MLLFLPARNSLFSLQIRSSYAGHKKESLCCGLSLLTLWSQRGEPLCRLPRQSLSSVCVSVPSDVLGSVVKVSGVPRSGTMGTGKVSAEGEIHISSTSGLFEFGIWHSHSRGPLCLGAASNGMCASLAGPCCCMGAQLGHVHHLSRAQTGEYHSKMKGEFCYEFDPSASPPTR